MHLIKGSQQVAVLVAAEQARLAAAKQSYTTRRLALEQVSQLLTAGAAPEAGDLLLARVDKLGQHGALQGTGGRRITLFPGDEIIVAYGNRYAPDQFEALVPSDLGPCDLVAGGGVAAKMKCSHARMKAPTRITPIGLLADAAGRALNLADFALPAVTGEPRAPVTIGIVGTSMNAGKTTTAAYLVRGLRAAGLRVAAAKVTGTGAGGDAWLMRDAGACEVLDFTDAGFASTYQAKIGDIVDGAQRILDALAGAGAEVAVVEVADGLLQRETSALLSRAEAARLFNVLVFAAQDSMGAVAGIEWLEQRALRVEALAGVLTTAPLGSREAAAATGFTPLTLAELSAPDEALRLFERARSARDADVAARAGRAA